MEPTENFRTMNSLVSDHLLAGNGSFLRSKPSRSCTRLRSPATATSQPRHESILILRFRQNIRNGSSIIRKISREDLRSCQTKPHTATPAPTPMANPRHDSLYHPTCGDPGPYLPLPHRRGVIPCNHSAGTIVIVPFTRIPQKVITANT